MTTVPPEIRAEVYRRDEWHCVAPRLDPEAGPCRNFHGEVINRHAGVQIAAELTVEHVRPGGGAMGAPRVHNVDDMVTLCWGHHLGHGVTGQGGSIWALKNKALTRDYLATVRGR